MKSEKLVPEVSGKGLGVKALSDLGFAEGFRVALEAT